MVIWFMAFVLGFLGTEVVLSHKQVSLLRQERAILIEQLAKTEAQNRILYQQYLEGTLKPKIDPLRLYSQPDNVP